MDARKKQKKKVQQMATPTKGDSVDKKKIRLPKTLPMIPLAFLAFWLWATFYYDSVFRICREYSFWVPDAEQMSFVLDNSYGILWYVGRMFLQLFRYPWLGGLFLALMLSLGSWLFGYCLRLPSRLRFIQYFPALAYVSIVTYHGLDLFFEAETGRILGIPLVVFLILTIWALVIRSFSRKKCLTMLRDAFFRLPMIKSEMNAQSLKLKSLFCKDSVRRTILIISVSDVTVPVWQWIMR